MSEMRMCLQIAHAFWIASLAAFAEVQITQIGESQLTWTNTVTNATYEVLIAPDLTSQWEVVSIVTNASTGDISYEGRSAFYSLRWVDPPSTIHTNLDTHIPLFTWSYLDINGDGQWDVQFHQETITTLDENGSGMWQGVYAMAHALCRAPFDIGQEIRMDVSPFSWVPQPQYQGVVLGSRANRMDGPWDGPWHDVTNGYLPIQFLISNMIHLGWINLSPSTNPDAWRVHSGAYRPAPETSLNAGE